VKRPEPWHVRAAHDDELRRLNKRFTHAVNSSWCGMFASRSGTASDDRASCFTSSASAPAVALEPRSLSRFQQIATRVAVGDASTDRSGRASACTPPAGRAKEDLQVPRRQRPRGGVVVARPGRQKAASVVDSIVADAQRISASRPRSARRGLDRVAAPAWRGDRRVRLRRRLLAGVGGIVLRRSRVADRCRGRAPRPPRCPRAG